MVVNYDKDGLKITGTRDNLVITLTNFSTKATDENGTEHTLVVSGELKADRSFDEATESEVTERTGSITVTFDGVDHTIETDLTITRTHSAEGESDEETVGTVTFDGTECEYEG